MRWYYVTIKVMPKVKAKAKARVKALIHTNRGTRPGVGSELRERSMFFPLKRRTLVSHFNR
jgi:hypothetical protein